MVKFQHSKIIQYFYSIFFYGYARFLIVHLLVESKKCIVKSCCKYIYTMPIRSQLLCKIIMPCTPKCLWTLCVMIKHPNIHTLINFYLFQSIFCKYIKSHTSYNKKRSNPSKKLFEKSISVLYIIRRFYRKKAFV